MTSFSAALAGDLVDEYSHNVRRVFVSGFQYEIHTIHDTLYNTVIEGKWNLPSTSPFWDAYNITSIKFKLGQA